VRLRGRGFIIITLLLPMLASAGPVVDVEFERAQLSGHLYAGAELALLLDEGGNASTFRISAQDLVVERDLSAFTVQAAGVVLADQPETYVVEYGAGTVMSLASRGGHQLVVLPLGPVQVEWRPAHLDVEATSGAMEVPPYLSSQRQPLWADLDGALAITGAGHLNLVGDFTIALWNQDVRVMAERGAQTYRTGHVDRSSLDVPGTGQSVKEGYVAQVFIHAREATATFDLPAEGIPVYARQLLVEGIQRAELHDAHGLVAGRQLQGDSVSLEGAAMRASVAGGSAARMTLAGDVTRAQSAGSLLAGPTHDSVSPLGWGVLAGLVCAMFVAAVAWRVVRAGKRGPYAEWSLNLAHGLSQRGRHRSARVVLKARLALHPDCATALLARAEALQAAGLLRRELAMRERADDCLTDAERVDNAMRLVVLHACLGSGEQAAEWLERCRAMDPKAPMRLALGPDADLLASNATLRAHARRALGVDVAGV
jgi:hypothetical protein